MKAHLNKMNLWTLNILKKNLCIFSFAITVPENVDGFGNWLPTSFTIQSKVTMASDAMSPSHVLRTSTKATCEELHTFSFSYVMNCKEGGTFENLNFQGNLGFNRSVPVLQHSTWTCLRLDVSCDNSPAKHFEIGFLHSFGGGHLIWAQCDQQTFMGSPKKEALLLVIASTRVSSYQPPIMVMPLSTLLVQEVPAPILLSKAPLLQPQRSWSMMSKAKNATMHP